MEFWRTKTFRLQAKVWNQKLSDSGFIDAEIDLKGDRALKQRATNAYCRATALERESKLGYYLLLGYLVNNTLFKNPLEEFVMIRHSEGITIKEIVIELRNKGVSRNRRTIRHIIRRWQMKWGVKTWTLHQMNLKSPVTD